ncbi:hypothetical protein [Streptomyces sp. ATCC 21386]|uniref:hypothetical protein n=1 Tax=Streptomyces sp. ATCC 21386 TaxID=2699428 RepID=UPI001BFF7769|nr:hypothetical protein [Streptomyces sp. ATCC 21386]
MGYELRRWLADRLPDGLSSGERLVALEIADQAREDSRVAYGPKFMETVVRRTGLSSWKQVGKVLGKLAAAGIELRQPILDADGKPVTDKAGRTMFACSGHQTTFRVPTQSECPALKLPPAGDLQAQESSPGEGSNAPGSSPNGGTNTGGSSPEQGTKEPESPPNGGTNTPERSPARGHKVPRPGGPTTQTTSVTTTTKDSAAVAAASDSPDGTLFDEPTPAPAAAVQQAKPRPAASRADEPQEPDAFDAFWAAYPIRVGKKDAIRSWNKTLKAGVPAARILQAATDYAAQKRGVERQYIKHPKTWLNGGHYDDEPPPPDAGRTAHRGYANPEDHDVYDEDML